jgi:hypothetical protein
MYNVEFIVDTDTVTYGDLKSLPSVGDIIEVDCNCCGEITAYEVMSVVRRYSADVNDATIRDTREATIVLESLEEG